MGDDNSKKRKLVIKEGSEFKIKVEGVQKFNDSFFKDIYDSAAVNAGEIIDNTKKYYSTDEKFKKDKEEANNIIAFVGERGTGKSSAMVSFAEALKHINDKDTNLDKPGLEKFKKLRDVSFVNLDIIDPALLEDKESIFEIIIAKMFAKFKEQMENESDTLEYDDKKRLLKKFQKVYMDLKTINTDRKDMFKESPYSEDIIETLVSLASGSNMRKSFIELVNEFLEMFADKEKNNRFLVIPIDDLDMNIKHSAEMAEQIRKYLMVPNVIVLMAIKMGQLKDSIEQMYRENYDVMLKEDNLSDDPKEMAERYIEKLIPNGRKLYLPDIRVHKDGMEENIEIVFEDEYDANKGEQPQRCRCDHEGSPNVCCMNKESTAKKEVKVENDLSIEDIVLKMTYEKTGLIFVKNDYDVHYLVPDNLRELQNYLIMLNKMDDIKLIPNDDEQDRAIRLHNIEKFETYFLKNWVRRNLSRSCIKIIDEFYNTSIKKKNKYIVNAVTDEIYIKFLRKEYSYQGLDRIEYIDKMSDYFYIVSNRYETYRYEGYRYRYRYSRESVVQAIELIVNLSNNSSNISFGDVLAVLNVYDKYLNNEVYKKFIFAIKTLYSISFYKMLKINSNFNDAKTLMGGNVVNTILFEQFSQKFMNYEIENYKKLRIHKSDDNMKDFMDKLVKKGECQEPNDILLFQNFELISYFLFFGKREKEYRKDNIPYYELDSQLGINVSVGRRSGEINVIAFITKILEPEDVIEKMIDSYNEFDDEENIRKNDKFKEIYNISLSKQIDKKNRIVLPIYSVELLEKIMEDTYYYFLKKFTKKANLQYFFEIFFKALYKSIDNNYEKIFPLRTEDDFKDDFINNIIIKKILRIDEDKKVPNLNGDVKTLLNYIEQQNENFEDNLYILKDRIEYFQKYGCKVQVAAIKNNANTIIANNGIGIKKGNRTLKSNFKDEFIKKITEWVDGVNNNKDTTDRKKVKRSYIDDLIIILKDEKNRLEMLEQNFQNNVENKKEKSSKSDSGVKDENENNLKDDKLIDENDIKNQEKNEKEENTKDVEKTKNPESDS